LKEKAGLSRDAKETPEKAIVKRLRGAKPRERGEHNKIRRKGNSKRECYREWTKWGEKAPSFLQAEL